jgi:hypothetical protein
MKSKGLLELISAALVEALQDVLSGVQTVVITPATQRLALADGGLLCTVEALRERVERQLALSPRARTRARSTSSWSD